MLKSTLLAALCGIAVAKVEVHYGEPDPVDMCCTAKAALTTAYSYCERQSDKDSCNSVGDDLCKWTACADVGYCVDPSDEEYYDDRRMLELDADYAPPTPKPVVSSGWGTQKTPKPTNPPKTPRPTEWKTPKPTNPPKTPRPTEWKTPKPTPDRYTFELFVTQRVIYPNCYIEHQNQRNPQRHQDPPSGRHQSRLRLLGQQWIEHQNQPIRQRRQSQQYGRRQNLSRLRLHVQL